MSSFPVTLGNNPSQTSSRSVEKQSHFVRQALTPGKRPVLCEYINMVSYRIVTSVPAGLSIVKTVCTDWFQSESQPVVVLPPPAVFGLLAPPRVFLAQFGDKGPIPSEYVQWSDYPVTICQNAQNSTHQHCLVKEEMPQSLIDIDINDYQCWYWTHLCRIHPLP